MSPYIKRLNKRDRGQSGLLNLAAFSPLLAESVAVVGVCYNGVSAKTIILFIFPVYSLASSKTNAAIGYSTRWHIFVAMFQSSQFNSFLFVCLFVIHKKKKHACNPGKVHCLKQANGKELDVLRERDFRAFGNIKSALGKSALDILPGSTAATQASAPSCAAIYRW